MSNINFNGISPYYNNYGAGNYQQSPQIYGVEKIEEGQTVNLKKYQEYELPLSGATVVTVNDQVDLNSSKYLRLINNLRSGEALTVGRADIDPSNSFISNTHFQIIRRGNSYYIRDLSTNGTTVIADGKFKNLNPNYLMQTYGNNQYGFRHILDKKYDAIRRASYSYESTFPRCSVDQMQKAIETIKSPSFIGREDCWAFRYIQPNASRLYRGSNQAEGDPERMSLNVCADPKLIDELDTLFEKGEYVDEYGRKRRIDYSKRNLNISYKTPYKAKDWTLRHDPVTIYSSSKFTKETIDAVCSISKKYSRVNPSGIPLSGALPGNPQVALEKTPTEEDFNKFIERVDKLNPTLAHDMRLFVYEGWNVSSGWHDFNASTGMISAMESVFNEYREYLSLHNGIH